MSTSLVGDTPSLKLNNSGTHSNGKITSPIITWPLFSLMADPLLCLSFWLLLSISLHRSWLSDNILANDSFIFIMEVSSLGTRTRKNNLAKCQVSAHLSLQLFFSLSFLPLQHNNALSLSPPEVYNWPKQTNNPREAQGHCKTTERREDEGRE